MVDASVLLAAQDMEDAHNVDARRLLRSGRALATIDLAAYEVVNVADTRWRDPTASERLQERIWLIATYGRLVRVDRALLDAAARLARSHAVSAYDAAYVAAAQRLGAPLASCDERDLVAQGLAALPGDVA